MRKLSVPVYWKCQLIGWSVASLYWGYTGYTSGEFNLMIGLFQFLSDIFLYILITHLYHLYALKHNFRDLSFNHLLKRLIPAVIVLGLAYTILTLLKTYIIRIWFWPDSTEDFVVFVRGIWVVVLVAGIRLMSIWLLAYHFYYYAQKEIRTSQENARLAIMNRDAQLDNLSAQLNPHFLFNSLNNIKSLVLENPHSARRGIDLLAELLRSGLYEQHLTLTTVGEEIDLVKDYLELEKLRFEERLQYNISVADKTASVQILRLSIQTLVENAIKHGINQLNQGGIIDVKVLREDDFIRFTVQNQGKMIEAGSATGVGLKNLKERLKLQYNDKARFDIKAQQDETVLATILIPL